MTSPDSPSPRTEAGRMLDDECGDQIVAGGSMLDILAIEAEAAQEAPAPEGLDAAIERVREYMDAAWDDGRWTYEGLARAALAAPPSPAEPPRRDEDRSDPLGIHAHERYGGPDVR